MSLAFSSVQAATGAAGASATTQSISPAVGDVFFVAVVSGREDSVDPATPTLTGAGQTWTSVGNFLFDTGGARRTRLTVFRCGVTAAGSGALTIDYGGATQANIMWSIIKADDADWGDNGGYAVVQSATAQGATTSVSVNLAAFNKAVNHGLAFVAVAHGSDNIVPQASWTELAEAGNANSKIEAHHRLNDNTGSASWTTSDAANILWLAEIREIDQAALSGSITPTGTVTTAWKALLSLAGSITPTGTLTTLWTAFLSLAGEIAPTGAVSFLKNWLVGLAEDALTLLQTVADTLHLSSDSEDTLTLDELEEDDR